MLRRTRRIIAIVVAAVFVLACAILAIPFNCVPYEVVEVYQVTEVRQESYVDTESYVITEPCEKEQMVFNDTPYSVPSGTRVPFSVTEANTRLTGSFQLPAQGGFYLYLSAGKIAYEQIGAKGDIDIQLPKGEYEALLREGVAWKDKVYLKLMLKWPALCEVTKYKEVTKTRDIPVTAESQRTVTRYKNASLWEIYFGKGN
jgi:hypothetical protein